MYQVGTQELEAQIKQLEHLPQKLTTKHSELEPVVLQKFKDAHTIPCDHPAADQLWYQYS